MQVFFEHGAGSIEQNWTKGHSGGWNYDVERNTKFRGGGVIQSAPLRTQVFLIGAREKTRSTEAKKGPWYNGTRKGAFNFDKGAFEPSEIFTRRYAWNINTPKKLFFPWKKRSAQFWVWILERVNFLLLTSIWIIQF